MILGFTPRHVWHRGEELFLNLNLLMNGASRHSPMCWMIPLTVGWNSSFIASQDIRSIPCEDHFTKFTLWVVKGTHKSTGQPGCLFAAASSQGSSRCVRKVGHLPLSPTLLCCLLGSFRSPTTDPYSSIVEPRTLSNRVSQGEDKICNLCPL